VRRPINLHSRHLQPTGTFRLVDLAAVGDELPAGRAEQLADTLRADTTRRVLVRHDRGNHTARVYIDRPTITQPPRAG
jgi:hypothetical protein